MKKHEIFVNLLLYILRYIFKIIPYGTRVFHNRYRRYNLFSFFLSVESFYLKHTVFFDISSAQSKNKIFPYPQCFSHIKINIQHTKFSQILQIQYL